MRSLVTPILGGALVLAAAVPARAQDTAPEDLYPADSASQQDKAARVVGREGIKSIRLFGGIDFWGVGRSNTFDVVFNRSGTTSGRDEGFINAVFHIGVDIQVNEALAGYFTLETGPSEQYAAERHRVGDDNSFARFREGYATITTAAMGLHKDTFDGWLKVGIQNVRFENRRFPQGEGHPFLLDALHSENPFTGTPGLAARANGMDAAAILAAGGTPTVFNQFFSRNTFLGGNAWFNNFAAQPREQEAGGAVLGAALVRDLRKMLNVDVQLGALTILETGFAQADSEVAFANIDFSFGKPNYERDLPDHHSKVNILAAGFSAADAYVGSVGGGLSLFLANNLFEVFGEGQYQGGAYVNARNATGSDVTRHESWGGYGGLRLQFPWTENRFYLEVSGAFYMGDDGSPFRASGRQAKNMDFMSLENNNQTLIVEGSQVGFDFDSNYFAIKGEMGLTWKSIDFAVVGGMFQLVKTPNTTVYAANIPAGSPANFEFDDNLGIEVDVNITWRPSDVVAIYLKAGNLFGSDFLDEWFGEKSFMAGAIGATIRF